MIITKTPFRVSFAGGGSDIPDYYRQHGGAVVSVAINKYMYLSMHPYFFPEKTLLKYSKTELVDSVEDIQHPIIKEIFKSYGIQGVDFVSVADIPSGTGLGSSSSFTVGMINLCNVYTQQYMGKYDIAEKACDVEINRLGEPIGKQDQYAASFGGVNHIAFNKDDSVTVERLVLSKDLLGALENNLMLFYFGAHRSASKILKEQKSNMASDAERTQCMGKMVDLADELRRQITLGNIDAVGEIMHENWLLKRTMAKSISNPEIDEAYEFARKNGATGGKLLGAGGGGFMMFYVPMSQRDQFRETMSQRMRPVDFSFDHIGTNVLHYSM